MGCGMRGARTQRPNLSLPIYTVCFYNPMFTVCIITCIQLRRVSQGSITIHLSYVFISLRGTRLASWTVLSRSQTRALLPTQQVLEL